MDSLSEKLRLRARELGFDHCAFSPAQLTSIHKEAYAGWISSHAHAGMAYLENHSDVRRNPHQLWPEAKSVLSLGVSYFQGAWPEKPEAGFGRVARYAWGQDYHPLILERLNQFLKELPGLMGGPVEGLCVVDTKPVLERAMASQSGAGFIGKNTLFILPSGSAGATFHVGSFLFLGEILLNVDVENLPPGGGRTKAFGCGDCTRCLESCPTKAFDGPFKLNAGRCISYLTIENKGWIPRALREKMSDWVIGCDACQDVCPFNSKHKETTWPEFNAAHGAGAWISLEDILIIPTQAAFNAKWGKTPLSRAKRKGLIRNACVAAGNTKAEALGPALTRLLEDPEPMIRGHALWALSQMTPGQTVKRLAEKLRSVELDVDVLEEIEFVLMAK